MSVVGCGIPALSNGVQLTISATNEGAEIMYECMSGFQPHETLIVVCGSNGHWSSDPAPHRCIGQNLVPYSQAHTQELKFLLSMYTGIRYIP